jgi:hypothetical protein
MKVTTLKIFIVALGRKPVVYVGTALQFLGKVLIYMVHHVKPPCYAHVTRPAQVTRRC